MSYLSNPVVSAEKKAQYNALLAALMLRMFAQYILESNNIVTSSKLSALDPDFIGKMFGKDAVKSLYSPKNMNMYGMRDMNNAIESPYLGLESDLEKSIYESKNVESVYDNKFNGVPKMAGSYNNKSKGKYASKTQSKGKSSSYSGASK